jgi:hypothetical protein
LLADPRGGDIDRTLGYDPSEYTVQPDFKILQNPTHDVQITWIRHASFLIQLGGKYQILIIFCLQITVQAYIRMSRIKPCGVDGFLNGMIIVFTLPATPATALFSKILIKAGWARSILA